MSKLPKSDLDRYWSATAALAQSTTTACSWHRMKTRMFNSTMKLESINRRRSTILSNSVILWASYKPLNAFSEVGVVLRDTFCALFYHTDRRGCPDSARRRVCPRRGLCPLLPPQSPAEISGMYFWIVLASTGFNREIQHYTSESA